MKSKFPNRHHMPESEEVIELENRLGRPLFNIDDYSLIRGNHNHSIFGKEDPLNEWLMQFEYRKCYRLNEEERIIALNLYDCKIDVNDLEHLGGLSSLETLSLSYNHFSDLSPLRSLSKLRSLNLRNTHVNDLGPLSSLFSLQSLFLWNTHVIDLNPLSSLSQLQSLNLSSTKVSDIGPLRLLTGLRSLDLRNSRLTDLNTLCSLSNLKSLDLWNTKASDLSPLSTLFGLRSLHLSSNKISELDPLSNLSDLQSLYLSYTQVRDLTPLCSLSSLESLFLGNVQVNDLSPLSSISSLRSLDLSSNNISDLHPLKSFAWLKSLYLGNTQVSNLNSLTTISGLHSLDLRDTQVSNLKPLSSLSGLRSINLRNTQVSDLTPLTSLSHLETLDLSSNKVSDLRPLSSLPGLHTLELQRTRVSNLTPLSSLPQLRSLDLGNTHIRDLSPLSSLPQLNSLNLSGNKITDLRSLSCLYKIRSLNLHDTQIIDLKPLSTLSDIQSLDLSNTPVSDLSPLSSSPNLRSINLSFTQISDLDPLNSLLDLQSIFLANSKVSDLSPLSSLQSVRTLDATNCYMTELPAAILRLGIEIEEGSDFIMQNGSIFWSGCEIETPEIEILRRGHEAIVDYFATLKSGEAERPMREAKVLVVGEAEVGKTSLIKQLLGENFDKGERKTHDIGRHRLPLTCGSKGEINLRIWDFGGQDIMHATHEFFLTKRSVYVLVLNSRQNQSQSRIEYWLKLIATYGQDSPVIVVCNKCDEEAMDLPWKGLQKKYPQIKHYVKRVSCNHDEAKGIDKREGLEEVKQRIADVIDEELDEVGKPMFESWFKVKAELERRAEEDGEDFLSLDRYHDICSGKEVLEGTEDTLLDFLHDLGVVLHFGKGHPQNLEGNPLLEQTNVLNPAWVTAAIYKILNDGKLAADDKGLLTKEHLTQLLEEVDECDYYNREVFIQEMMRQFELCFDIEGENGSVLIPNLLPKDAPDTGEWIGAVHFRYQYKVLPQSVISRFIVRMHGDISQHTYWRTGVVLEREGIRAKVSADLEDSTIDIVVKEKHGKNPSARRRILEVIRSEFEKIHRPFGNELGVKELVPDPENHGVYESYQKLMQMEADGESTVWIEDIGKRPLAIFLDGIESKGKRNFRNFVRNHPEKIDAFRDELSANIEALEAQRPDLAFEYDVFLSHNSVDKPKVEKLAIRLDEAGLKVWYDDWVIQGGDDIPLAVEQGTEISRIKVLCLSPSALNSDWVNSERSAVHMSDPANRKRRFIPLLIEDCETIPGFLQRFKQIDYRDESDEAFQQLVNICRANT